MALREVAARTIVAVAMIASASLIANVSRAQSLEAIVHGDLRLGSSWAAPTRNFTLATEAYLTISNTGQSPDRLLGATAADARVVRIHKWIDEDGLRKIRSLPDLTINPGASVVMEPMVLNLKLMGLRPARRGTRPRLAARIPVPGRNDRPITASSGA